MPAVSISDENLHIQLKIWVAQRPRQNIGRTAEDFIRFALDSGLGDLTEEQKKKVKDYIKNLRG